MILLVLLAPVILVAVVSASFMPGFPASSSAVIAATVFMSLGHLYDSVFSDGDEVGKVMQVIGL
jgi:hypothetical protein